MSVAVEHEALIAELEARVAARGDAGDYDGLAWLDEPVAPVEPATPVDRFLRWPRAAVDPALLVAGGRGGPYRAIRRRVAHWVGAALEDWDVRQADADATLRDALAWIALVLRAETQAREQQERRLLSRQDRAAKDWDTLSRSL